MLRKWFQSKRRPKQNYVSINHAKFENETLLTKDLNQNLLRFQTLYEKCFDVVFHPFLIHGKIQACLIYIEGMTNVEELDLHVLSPLMQKTEKPHISLQELLKEKLSVAKMKEIHTFTDCVSAISLGSAVLLIDREPQAISIGLAKWEKRSIQEPEAESSIRGPREGFTETLGVNTSLIRRKIRNPDLKMESMNIGRYTETTVVIAYIDGIVDLSLVDEVKSRLKRIQIDGILESGYIEEFIEDNPRSPFPQLLSTERPDVAASSLLQGQTVILVDGTPFVLIAPVTLFSFFQAGEDYYERFWSGTTIRLLRYLFIIVSLFLPSLYVAVITYHQEMIPTTLLISMAGSREAIPFPALVEALLMEITFETLREAGVRLPKQVGAAVSIVGALVIGEAATSAGIVSAPMVMVVAITGISSFLVPRYVVGISLRLMRFPMMIMAGTLGLVGIVYFLLILAIHLCTLRSFGVPYLSPLAPFKGKELKDILVRAPWWAMNKRPHFTGNYNANRQALNQKPDPTKGNE